MAWRRELRWQVTIDCAIAMALAVAALAVALISTASIRAETATTQQLVPAAGAVSQLLDLYAAQQASLRDYVLTGHASARDAFDDQAAEIPAAQDKVRRLTAGSDSITSQLAGTVAAYRDWLAGAAGPQLAAMNRGDAAAARALQAAAPAGPASAQALGQAGTALQQQVTNVLQATASKLDNSRRYLLAALIAMCVVVAGITVDGAATLWIRLLRPFGEIRRAVDAVTAGNYDARIPDPGPAELADLGHGIELMRTRLVAALAEQGRAEDRFRRLFDGAPDPMIAVASDGLIAMANAQAVQLFGYSELIGQPVELLVPGKWRAPLAAEYTRYFADPASRPIDQEFKLSGLRRDGTRFPAEVTLSALPTEGGMLVTAAIRDISERLVMEAERERLRTIAEQERAERRRQQTQRLESLGQLVGGVAHDFNNLLNVIQGYADFAAEQVQPLAQDDDRLAAVLGDIEQVRAAAQQAIRLTRQLLTFARHEVTTPEILDLNDVVERAGLLLRRTLGEHIDLTITPQPGLWRVKADRSQVEQVLVNLAVNARDAMPGGGCLTIDTGNTEVDAAYATRRPRLAPGRYARLRVSDTGAGMDRETADRVFEPFFTTKPKGHGTGLGLATVYGIATGTGGDVEIYSEQGLGTTVSVLLPVTDEDVQPAAAPVTGGGDRRGHGETILLVEDEERLRELTSRILAGAGYRVCLASGGAEAVRRASDPGQPIDLLLTDVIMPEMLGNEVAARVAAIRPGVPTLFMSGYAQPILDSHGIPAPRFEIVEKPFTEAALLGRIRSVLARADRPLRSACGYARVGHTGAMAEQNVQAVVFDLGGVLIDWNPRYLYRQLFSDETAMETFLATICTDAWHHGHDLGVDVTASCRQLADLHPEYRGLIMAWAERGEEMAAGQFDGTVEILRALRDQGVSCYALSNMEPDAFAIRRDRFEFMNWFDGHVISGLEGVAKPDRKIFDLLLERYDLDPRRTVFIDDVPRNIETARELGLLAIRFTSPGELRTALATRGLRMPR